MNNILEVEFTSIDIDGSCVGKVGDKTIKSYGLIVGEKAKVKIIKKKSNFFWAIPIEIVKSSE
jgi:tRNA/tmRNA/rRNA uracil-C5-methylase (TrmA/RlmC/RlmD family)